MANNALFWTEMYRMVSNPALALRAVGARSAAQQAVFWHRLPKMALFGANKALFWSVMYYMLSNSNVRYCIAFLCIIRYILLPYGITWYFNVLNCIALDCMVSYVVLWYPTPLHGIACYCVVGFDAQAVFRKRPIYLIYEYVFQ